MSAADRGRRVVLRAVDYPRDLLVKFLDSLGLSVDERFEAVESVVGFGHEKFTTG